MRSASSMHATISAKRPGVSLARRSQSERASGAAEPAQRLADPRVEPRGERAGGDGRCGLQRNQALDLVIGLRRLRARPALRRASRRCARRAPVRRTRRANPRGADVALGDVVVRVLERRRRRRSRRAAARTRLTRPRRRETRARFGAVAAAQRRVARRAWARRASACARRGIADAIAGGRARARGCA